jgi:hypothetical protein
MSSLSRKTAAKYQTEFKKKSRGVCLLFVVMIFCVAGFGFAQEKSTIPAKDQQDEQENELPPGDDEQPASAQAIPVPIEEISKGGQTFLDNVFQNTRNRLGFSLAAYQAYSNNISTTEEQRNHGNITVFVPRIFFNAGKRKSAFHVDFGTGYRVYEGSNRFNTWDYSGDAHYIYRPSKRSSLRVSDQFSSAYNDVWAFLSQSSSLRSNLSFSNEVLFNRRRITRNFLTAEFQREMSKKIRVGVFGGHTLYRYSGETSVDTAAFEAGASLNFRITSWLTLTNRYSAYLNDVKDELRNARIHRLQVGGLDFRLTQSWRVWGEGSLEVVDHSGSNHIGQGITGGIGYTSTNALFTLRYHHGFTSPIGILQLLSSDVINADYGYLVTRWMRPHLQSSYHYGTELNDVGWLKTFSGGGGVEFMLGRNFVISANSYYQNQRSHDFSVRGLGLSRFSAYVGLNYMWPSMRNKGLFL